MDITIYTNDVAGGWSPLDQMLGGSEECVTELAAALHRIGARVTLYGSVPRLDHNGVLYRPRAEFDEGAVPDALLTWKDSMPWLMGARARLGNVHWSSDVEHPWPVPSWLTAFVCLGSYHRGRLLVVWGESEQSPTLRDVPLTIVPHGTPATWRAPRLTPGAPWRERAPIAVYCSSPDRGLLTLLHDWAEVRRAWPGIALVVTYGWRRFDAVARNEDLAKALRAETMRLLEQRGIFSVGELTEEELVETLCRARWWVHPLCFSDSELFCLSAVKAQACGALPVILRANDSGLMDTVGTHVPYEAWVRGQETLIVREAPSALAPSWDALARRRWWLLLMNEWLPDEPLSQEDAA